MSRKIDINILINIDCKESIIKLKVENWDELFDKILLEIEERSGNKFNPKITETLFENTEAKDINFLKEVFNNKVPIEEIIDVDSLFRNICMEENSKDISMSPVVTEYEMRINDLQSKLSSIEKAIEDMQMSTGGEKEALKELETRLETELKTVTKSAMTAMLANEAEKVYQIKRRYFADWDKK